MTSTIAHIHKKVFELIQDDILNTQILDVGAGDGEFEKLLLSYGVTPENIIACDNCPERFGAKGLKCIKMDLDEDWRFNSENFDIVVSIETAEHLKNLWHHLDEAYRVLKQNGILILTTPNVQNFVARLYYLFTSKLPGFGVLKGYDFGHILPIFDWILEGAINGKFIIEKRVRCGKTLKILPFAPTNIWKLRKVIYDG